MKVILLNGSPRKNWNTHRLLLEAERGAKEMGAETELIHLFDLKYTDCKACFACKRRGNKTNGICAIRDDLRPVLEKIHEANAVIIGTPIYHLSARRLRLSSAKPWDELPLKHILRIAFEDYCFLFLRYFTTKTMWYVSL